MKSGFRSVILSMLSLVLSGCGAASFAVANLPVHFSAVKIERDVAYGPEEWQKLDIYSPAADIDEETPVIVFFYGGRWTVGHKEQYSFVGHRLAQSGYKVVIPDYAKYPDVKFPTFVEDGARAVSWTSENMEGNLFVSGHSSGAHIGALITVDPGYLAAYNKDRSIISAFAGMAGPYDFIPEQDDLKDIFGPPERYKLMQVPNFVDGRQPPLFLLQGKDDTTVIQRNLNRLRDRVEKTGGVVETKLYPGIDHVKIIGTFSWVWHDKAPVSADIIDFFERHK